MFKDDLALNNCCGLKGPEMNNTKRCTVYSSIYQWKYRQ